MDNARTTSSRARAGPLLPRAGLPAETGVVQGRRGCFHIQRGAVPLGQLAREAILISLELVANPAYVVDVRWGIMLQFTLSGEEKP